MRLLPIDYPIRNLGRRPSRTFLTGLACALAAGVLVAVVSFVNGLEASFSSQGRPDVALLLSTSAQRDIIRSAISPAVADLVAADIDGIAKVHGVAAVSPEIHMGTNVRLGQSDEVHAGFVRGITDRAFLVHDRVTLVEGRLPGSGEVLVGSLVAKKLGVSDDQVAVGRTVRIENGTFRIVGRFRAPGTTIESEIWAPLNELKARAQRDDISCVFARVREPDTITDIDVFTQRRLDLELSTIRTDVYYAELASYFAPIRALAWIMAIMIATTVVLTGANSLNTTVQDRIRELATLRAIGYGGAALVTSLLIEALLLAAAAGMTGLVLARIAVQNTTFQIGMGAFALEVGGAAILAGFSGVLLIGLLGTLPASVRLLRMHVATALVED